MSKHYLNEVGTMINVNCGTDISTASNVSFKVKKPDNTLVSWDATTSGQVASVYTAPGDFDIPGIYYLQVELTKNGWTGKSETVQFTVFNTYA